MEEIYCKAGNVKLTEKEAEKIYESNQYICTYTSIYQPHFSQAQGMIYFMEIAKYKGIAKRGKYHVLTATQINNIIGFNFLYEF